MGFWRFLNDRLFNVGLRRRQRSTQQAMADLTRSLELELAIDYGSAPLDEPTPAELAARARRLFNAGRRL